MDTFVGLVNFSPTGSKVLDTGAVQVNIHLEKTVSCGPRMGLPSTLVDWLLLHLGDWVLPCALSAARD